MTLPPLGSAPTFLATFSFFVIVPMALSTKLVEAGHLADRLGGFFYRDTFLMNFQANLRKLIFKKFET